MTDSAAVDAKIPIVLGLVGHRTILPQDVEGVTKKLERLFQQFENEYPHSPLVLMTSLSPGADTLAADLVLADTRKSRWSVLAPLPGRYGCGLGGRARVVLESSIDGNIAIAARFSSDPYGVGTQVESHAYSIYRMG